MSNGSARFRFCDLAMAQLGKPVLWGARGPEAFDCSGLVAWCLRAVGGPDLRATHNAQKLFDETRRLTTSEEPLPGDLAFYGADPLHVTHVAVWLGPQRILSADGATSRRLDLASAQADPAARVRLHERQFRRDFLEFHRSIWLDELDKISR